MPRSSGIIPGSHSEEHKAAWLAGKAIYFAAGGPPKCAATAKHGGPCGAHALRGHPFCLTHAAIPVQRERRAMRLARPMTTAQRERAARREAARGQREVWRFDRWAPGETITLGPREDRFQEDARAAGFDPALFSPETLDAARWAWLHVQLGRVTPAQFRVRVAWHADRD